MARGKSCPLAHRLYTAAERADRLFHRALVKEYGAKRAGDARYRYTHKSPSVNHAKRRFERMTECLRAEWERGRGDHRRGLNGLRKRRGGRKAHCC